MPSKKVLLIGAGRRAQTVILPAIYCLRESHELTAIVSRSSKSLSLFKDAWHLNTANTLDNVDFKSIDLILVAVTPEAVPEVIRQLTKKSANHTTLVLDTPVLPHTQLGAVKYFNNFKKVLVMEESIALPPYVLTKSLIKAGKIGSLRHIHLFHSGFKYHTFASLKYLADASYFKSTTSKELGGKLAERTVNLPRRVMGHVLAHRLEPRVYSVGRFLIIGSKGAIVDYPLAGENIYRIGYKIENNIYRALTLNGAALEHHRLDTKYLQNIPDGLMEQNLMITMKIRGLMTLLTEATENISPYHYQPLSGIYDNLAMKFADKFGYFKDFRLPGSDASAFQMAIKLIAGR